MPDKEKNVSQCPACGYIGKDGKDLLAIKDQELKEQRKHIKTLQQEVSKRDVKLTEHKLILRNMNIDCDDSEVVQKALDSIESRGGIDGVRAALLKEKARGELLRKNVVALTRKLNRMQRKGE